jgi:hypothetical protein
MRFVELIMQSVIFSELLWRNCPGLIWQHVLEKCSKVVDIAKRVTVSCLRGYYPYISISLYF